MKFFFLFLIPFTLSLNAQYTVPQKLHICLNFSADYCYRKLDADKELVQFVVNSRNSIEKAKLGYSVGFSVLYPLSSKLILDIGLQYSDKGERLATKKLIPAVPDPQLPKYYSANYHYNYIDVPVKLDFVIYNKKIRIFLSSGISANFFISNTVTNKYEYADGNITKSSMELKYDFNSVNFAFLAGIGTDIQLNKKLNLRIQPLFRHSISSIIDARVQSYLWSFGLNTALHLM